MNWKLLSNVIMGFGLMAGTAAGYTQEATRIEIDTKTAGPVISPLLFGHNLEHTRKAICKGISAEMIANRKFAATDCGLPMRWTTLTGKGVAIDDKVAYAGKHSVRLDNTDGTFCGIWQKLDEANRGKNQVGPAIPDRQKNPRK